MTDEPTYQIEIQFNSKANLVGINTPPGMGLAWLGEHLTVALQFVLREVSKREITATHPAVKD